MKKTILITLCCASLMLITPLTGVAQENTVSNNLPEQPKDVEGLVAQIRTVVDEILQKYGHIPMVRSLCNVVLNSLGLVGRILYCIILLILLIPFGLLFLIFLNLGIVILYELLAGLTLDIITEFDSDCTRYFNPSFKSIYTLSETKDCPCLEE